MPGPLDGLGIPTPKDVGDWLEEMFGKGTNPNGSPGPGNDKDGKGKEQGKRRPGGPSVEDLYPKTQKINTNEVLATNVAFQNSQKAFSIFESKKNKLVWTMPMLQVSKQMHDLQNSIFQINQQFDGPTINNYYDN